MERLRSLLPFFVLPVLLYACLFAGGSALGLIGPDEPRYVAIAREMAESGDWVTPRLQGRPWFEKPVLYYWAAAASFKLFGESETAARLPSTLGAVAAALALAWLAFRITSRGAFEASFFTLLVIPSTVAVIGFGRAATTDMLFSSLLALALVAAYGILWEAREGARKLGWHIAWGAALGLATLAKGPAAVLLAGGAVAIWCVSAGRWRDSLRLMSPASLATFFAVALPWYALCAWRNPDFFQVFFLSHNIERFLTPVFRHEQPFWFFGPVLLLGLVPWAPLLVLGLPDLADAWRARRLPESRGFFVLCWAVFPLLFFTASRSKLPGYILPAVLPLAMLMARAMASALEAREALSRRTAAAVGLMFVALAISGQFWQAKLPSEAIEKLGQGPLLMRWMVSLGLSGVAIAWLAIRRKPAVSLLLSAVVTAGLALAVLKVGALLDVDLSPRATAAEALRLEPDPRNVSVHRLHRAWHYGLNYYLRHPLEEWTEQTPSGHLVVTSDDGLLDLLRRGYNVRAARRMNKRAILVFAEKRAR